jgi:hypothetical protein
MATSTTNANKIYKEVNPCFAPSINFSTTVCPLPADMHPASNTTGSAKNTIKKGWFKSNGKYKWWIEGEDPENVTLYPAFVLFLGSENEKLGTNKKHDVGGDKNRSNAYFNGVGAVTATVIIGTKNGDIKEIRGYTMSSDPNEFSVVDNGEYTVTRLSDKVLAEREKNKNPPPFHSPWQVEKGKSIRTLHGEINKKYPKQGSKINGIYIHKPNDKGWAGTYVKKDTNGKPMKDEYGNLLISGVSEGCLLIDPLAWGDFNDYLKDINEFPLIIERH